MTKQINGHESYLQMNAFGGKFDMREGGDGWSEELFGDGKKLN